MSSTSFFEHTDAVKVKVSPCFLRHTLTPSTTTSSSTAKPAELEKLWGIQCGFFPSLLQPPLLSSYVQCPRKGMVFRWLSWVQWFSVFWNILLDWFLTSAKGVTHKNKTSLMSLLIAMLPCDFLNQWFFCPQNFRYYGTHGCSIRTPVFLETSHHHGLVSRRCLPLQSEHDGVLHM